MIGGVFLAIGDSLTYGARDEYGLSYPEMVARMFSVDRQMWTAVNRGVSGETSAEILRRCYTHVHEFPDAHEVFLWAGFNDAKTQVKTPPNMYFDNMVSMINSIIATGRACYLLNLPAMEGFGAPDFVDNKLIEMYNDELDILYDKYSTCRVFPVDVSAIPSKHRVDGVHLTHAGNVWVAGRVHQAIVKARSR